ncbi:MAG: hypothetical protein BroJett011_46760 [Chloroflexota bacterium]|nr:MAG: hypothetical protein BroJett011_46760 [Chloroflexota bacterium]
MPDTPLCFQFSHYAAKVWCEDDTLRQTLSTYFRHCLYPVDCLSNTTFVGPDYRLAALKNLGLELWADDSLLYRGSSHPFAIERLMQDATMRLAAHCQDHLVLHAAGLAYKDCGLILCGGSGSGKSTLAAWLTAAGFDYLTDELVAVTLNGTEMSGLARPISLKMGSAFVWQQWLRESDQHSLLPITNSTVLLNPELLRPCCVRGSVRPHLLLFPRFLPGEPLTVQDLTPAEAAFRLMAGLVNARNLPDHAFITATRLAQQTRAYTLSYADLTEATDSLQQIVLREC